MPTSSRPFASPRGWLAPLVVCAALGACSPKAAATIYYVDFDAGSDAAAGSSPSTPWKHAPGDPLATAVPASAKLKPGDTIRFHGGVRYRSELRLEASGAEGSPITYAGDQWGPEPAIFEGGEPVQSVQPCPSAEACGGGANWSKLSLITFNAPHTSYIKLFDTTGVLFASQFPRVKDPFFGDDVANYVELPQEHAQEDSSGTLRSATLAKALAGGWQGGELNVWVQGNEIKTLPITAVAGDRISYGGGPANLYRDRPNRAAVVNVAALIDGPGFFATLAPGSAVAFLRPDAGPGLWVGSGRKAIDLRGHSDIVIRGFVFEHYSEGKYGEGVQISNGGELASRIQILDNTFRRSAFPGGEGPIMIGNVDDTTISGNTFADIESGSGIRTSRKPLSRLRITGNTFKRLGRTAVTVMGASDTTVSDNTIEGLFGIHGNGIAAYWDNRGVAIRGNRIVNTTRPLTVEGKPNEEPGEHKLVIEKNFIASTDPAGAAIISWGLVRTMTISDNVLVGPGMGVLLSPDDKGIVVTNNYTTGIHTKGPQPSDWVIRDNLPATKAQLREASAAAPGPAR